jgi:hypothetical protein
VPILMTALAAGLALVPLALAAGPAGQRDPVADGGGHPVRLLASFDLLLNMIVVPALYLRFGSRQTGLHPRSKGGSGSLCRQRKDGRLSRPAKTSCLPKVISRWGLECVPQ